MNRPWTGADLIRLRRLAADGWTMAEAGQELGRSRRAIAGQARKYGIPFKGHLRNTWEKNSSARWNRNRRRREANKLYMRQRYQAARAARATKPPERTPNGTPGS